jgi:hypothetical protein
MKEVIVLKSWIFCVKGWMIVLEHGGFSLGPFFKTPSDVKLFSCTVHCVNKTVAKMLTSDN